MSATPSLDTLLSTMHVVSIPMQVRFRGVMHREIALFAGPSGWGEFSPFLEYDAPEAARWLDAAIDAAWGSWPAPLRSSVPVNSTVPAVEASEVSAVLARYDGCRTAKVKVAERGQALTDDVSRVAAVRDAMGADAFVRIDANGGWSVDDAASAIAALAPYGLEYVEQPCATVEELVDLRKLLARNGIDVLIAADESIRKAEDPLRVARLGAADVAVVKVAPLGGVAAALQIATDAGLPTVVSSAIDSSVGIASGVALAAALPELPHACGLGTLELMAGDVVADSLVPQRGSIAVRRPEPVAALLEERRAPEDRQAWWRDRVAACFAHLTRH
ncbi:o-succinylbenzoate synthase [Flexivirga endophytica]|uniref:o-succinylbenzoate synthase n=1 Tax=Flexivirga endophytica TaxID=1849103 RepID=A0A916TGA2_9MICO|nr:o-succinylbenzoate synthase [Flexivirga endophytica]GGB42819.1 o-succinylbenzoate synthase [Flexivirga endophytica]GHB64334.1 o-succinylbenzoate synthase [Flexivirga endophytica]